MKRSIIGLAAAAAILASPALAGNPPAVQWQKTFGSWDTICKCVQQTSDNGFIMAGHVRKSLTNLDIYLLKTDSLGNTLWQRSYGGPDHDFAFAVRQTSDGGYILAGVHSDSSKAIIMKTDSLGDSLWSYSGPFLSSAMDVQQTNDGGYVAAGIWGSTGGVNLMKLDAQGNCEWTRKLPDYYSETGGETGGGGPIPVQQTADGGYITAAEALLKTDSLGNLQWGRTYDDVGVIFSVRQTTDGGYIATGIGPNPSIPSHTQNTVLLKTDSQGHKTWKRIFRGDHPSFAYGVRQLPDGGYFITGYSHRPYLIRTDSQGTCMWSATPLGERSGVPRWGEHTEDGGYIIAVGQHLVKLASENQ